MVGFASGLLLTMAIGPPALPQECDSVISWGGPRPAYAAGSNPAAVVTADFNRDGHADIALANATNPGRVSVLLGTGTGTFGPRNEFVVGNASYALATADFNRDGKPDVATANRDSNSVSVLLGNGSGGFSGALAFAVGLQPLGIAAGDLNGDGNPDLAVSSAGANSVAVLLGAGTGSFSAASFFPVGASPRDVAIGDVNADGKADLVVANFGAGTASILSGDGLGGFTPLAPAGAGAGAFGVALADFDRDGHVDLAVSNFLDWTITVRSGDGSGAFGPAATYPARPKPRSIIVRDFDKNGALDVAVASSDGFAGTLLTGRPAGGFDVGLFAGFPNDTAAMAAADFDEEGRIDLAVVSQKEGLVTVDLNVTVPVLCIENVLVTEPDAGTVTASFHVSLSSSARGTVSVAFATTDGSATGGLDYVSSSATLVFPPGTLGATIPIQVLGDTLDEADFEQFSVELKDAVNATIYQNPGVGVIADNDPVPSLSIEACAAPEGNTGTTACSFTVRLSAASGRAVSVGYNTFSGTATVSTDYEPRSGAVTFEPGSTARAVPVTVYGDTAPEPDETLGLQIMNPVNAGIAEPQDFGTIVDDDGPDLSVTKTDGRDTASPGQALAYTIVVSNAGPAPATGVSVVDEVPAELTSATWTCSGSGGATCTASGSGSIDDTADVPVGGAASYTLSGTVAANPTRLRNTATVTPPAAAGGDPDRSDNRATDEDLLTCGAEKVMPADGRLGRAVIAAGTTEWFGSTLQIGNAYSVEFENLAEPGAPPGVVTVFAGDDGCSGVSSVAVTDTSVVDPAASAAFQRLSFTATGTSSFFRVRLANSSGNPIQYSFSLADTTLYSAAWSTNGSFDTFYSFQNTTSAALTATLRLFDVGGAPRSAVPLSIPAGQTVSTNTAALGIGRNATGTARLTHDGPPGALLAEAAVANFSIVPAYVQPVRFVAPREAR